MTQSEVNIDGLMQQHEAYESQIHALQQTIAAQVHELEEKRNRIWNELEMLVYTQSKDQLSDKDYGCGTANIETASFKIKTVVSKNVTWDEKALCGIAAQIKEAGQDPEAYIKYKLSVTETAYKSFPEHIQKAFEPARSVEPSAPKISIERKS